MLKLTRSAALIAAGAVLPAAVSAQPPESERCAGQAAGSSCWMEIDNRPGCYLWNGSLAEEEAVTWNGACVDSLASGFGAEEWRYLNDDGEEDSQKGAGEYVAGKRHGDWTLRDRDGGVEEEGPYMDGKRHGDWTRRWPDGSVWEATYVDGKTQGWTPDFPPQDAARQGRPGRGTAASAPASTTSTTAPRGRCLIPGFPDPPDPESLGLPWCPASVGFQVRSFAIAAGRDAVRHSYRQFFDAGTDRSPKPGDCGPVRPPGRRGGTLGWRGLSLSCGLALSGPAAPATR